MTGPTDAHEEIPVARVERRRLSLVWLIPVFAALGLAGMLAHQIARERGPDVSITFTRAEGLEPGAGLVHRGITVGVVREVRLSPALDEVVVRAEIHPHASAIASEGTQFWIVRPELSLSRVAGLETLLGPRYIAVRPAPPGAPRQRAFRGLDAPPADTEPLPDELRVVLSAPRLGAVSPGSPVLFRDVPVGEVRGATLAEDGRTVLVEAAIAREHAHLVRTNSRFWVASGVGVDWGLFRGLTLRADSLEALLRGAVGFATPNRPGDMVNDGHRFDLHDAPDPDWLEWDPALPIPGD
jgi:paraquat-inducible protein B